MPPKIPYSDRILLAQQRNPGLFAGKLVDVCVQHDEWCAALRGELFCSCVPDITLTTISGKYYVDPAGNCNKAGPEAEANPVTYDPRPGRLN